MIFSIPARLCEVAQMDKLITALKDEASKCIRCGVCKIHCPVYATLKTESTVARGKVRLIHELSDGNLELTPYFNELMSLCLNCGACSANCPPGVKTDEMILAVRAHIKDKNGLPAMYAGVLKGLLPHPALQALAVKLAYVYQNSGLQDIARASGVMRLFPGNLIKKEMLIPSVPERTFRQALEKIPLKKGNSPRVLYFISCMTNMVNADLGIATVKVLEEHGCAVIVPPEVKCCGMPHASYGDQASAKAVAAHNARIMLAYHPDYIVTDCATCGAQLKNYSRLAPNAESFGTKVYDINEFLVKIAGLRVGNRAVNAVVTYHDPCHLGRGQNVRDEPRHILAKIPRLIYKEMSEPNRCCGGAGTFNLRHYEVSLKILERKMAAIQQTGAELVATSCPACKLQLEHGIAQAGAHLKVVHPVELLAATFA